MWGPKASTLFLSPKLQYQFHRVVVADIFSACRAWTRQFDLDETKL
jgi:hypothetical protein